VKEEASQVTLSPDMTSEYEMF